MVGWRPAVVAMLGAAACLASSVLPASAWNMSGSIPTTGRSTRRPDRSRKFPLAVSPPVYQRKSGAFGGPQVAGPLYYARPAPPVPGLYRDDPALTAGSILAFDLDAALADAEAPRSVTVVRRGETPAPFTGPVVSILRDALPLVRSRKRDLPAVLRPRRLCR